MEEQILEKIDKNFMMSDKNSPIKKDEAKYIYEFLIQKKISRTLEIGLASGHSAAYIIAATRSEHIAIDPFQTSFQNYGIKNMEILGFQNYFIFKDDYSHNVLPSLLKENRKFDFIFIDGGHKFDNIFIDFYYSDLLLERNGYILFHDTWMRSTQLVLSFINTNRKDYKFIKVPIRNLALIQKVDKDDRPWTFHKEFFNLKSIISHNFKIWMISDEKNVLKSLILKVKEKFEND